MRRLSTGNKSRFAVFTLIIISIIIVLIIILNKTLNLEKEEYAIEKDVVTYDSNYEYVSLTSDAVIQKKWTGQYYLNESATGLSYELGTSAVTYNPIKNKLNLYGTFYEVAIDGEVTKTTKNVEVADMLNSKLYKIEDRKYLIVSDRISNQNGSLTAENYLMVVIDKSGNTLLLNNTIDVKTINAIVLETDIFKFDVANEKLLYKDTTIDLKKIIGSSNEYVKPKPKDEGNNNGEGGTTINVGGSGSQSSTDISVNVGGTTGSNGGTSSGGSSSNNKTQVIKSVSLRSVTPGATYLDVNYLITDPNGQYQVVFLEINGGGQNKINISLEKTKDFYRITGLLPNTYYSVSLKYKVVTSGEEAEEITEDVINVKTLKLQGNLRITKVTEDKIYFNLKIDKGSEYDNAKLELYIDNVKKQDIEVDIKQAISNSGWTGSIDKTADIIGKLTLSLKDVEDVELTTSAQIY